MASSDDKGLQFSLEQVIDAQRAKLMSAHAVQSCLHEVLLYVDGENAVMHAEVAQVVATLITEVTDSLDSVHIRRVIENGKCSGGPNPAT